MESFETQKKDSSQTNTNDLQNPNIKSKEGKENKDYQKIKVQCEGGISQELVTESHKTLSAELVCSICLEIVRNPKLCKSCQHMFCNDCITKQLSKSKFCPNRCIYKDQEVNLIFKKILYKIEFKCLYYKSGCVSIILYENFDKHIESCIWGDYKCLSPGCLIVANLRDIKAHVEKCPLKLVYCDFCLKEICKKNYETHYEECANKEVTCKYCKLKITNKEYIKHIETCDEYEVGCDECLRIVKRKEMNDHTEILCLKFQVEYWKAKSEKLEVENKDLKVKLKANNSQFLDKFVGGFSSNPTGSYSNNSINYLISNSNSNSNNHVPTSNINSNHLNIINNINNSNSMSLSNSNSHQQQQQQNPISNNNNNGNSNQLGSTFNRLFHGNYFHEELGNENLVDSSINIESSQQNAVHDQEYLPHQEFKSTVIRALKGMSGLVYTIADLSQYKENVGAIGNYNNVLVFNMATVEKYTELVGHCSYIWCIIHLADYRNNIIASASQDNTIKLWNLDQNCCEKTLTGHTNWVTTIQLFKLDPKILISASYDHNIKFWNLDSGECIKTIGSVFGKGVLNAYYAREGYIVYGSVGNSLKIYDYLTETEKFTLKGHTNLVNCFANLGIFNPNYIASGSDDKTVKIWNLLTGELVFNLPGHRECINSLTHLNGFNANLLASVSDDRTIRIWNLSRFECVAQLNFHSSWVKSIMHIKSNPEYLYSHGDTGSVVCWKIERCLDLDEA